jgi:plasmid stabilization system protein ParE
VNFVIRSGARRDILRQYEYYLVDKDAGPAAERFVSAVNQAIAAVCTRPGIGAPKKLMNAALDGLRSLPVKGFPEISVGCWRLRGGRILTAGRMPLRC